MPVAILIVAVWGAAIVGWGMNLYKFVSPLLTVADLSTITVSGMMLARAVGIFLAPFGAVLGYF